MEEVARSLGRSPWQAFGEVTLPPGVAGGGGRRPARRALRALRLRRRVDPALRRLHPCHLRRLPRRASTVRARPCWRCVLVALAVALASVSRGVRRADVARVGGGRRAAGRRRCASGRWQALGVALRRRLRGAGDRRPRGLAADWFATGSRRASTAAASTVERRAP